MHIGHPKQQVSNHTQTSNWAVKKKEKKTPRYIAHFCCYWLLDYKDLNFVPVNFEKQDTEIS